VRSGSWSSTKGKWAAVRAATLARGITMDIFERFSRIIDNYSFHQVGCLFIYDEGEFLAAESEREMQHRAGAKFEVLRRKDMEQRFPALNIKDNEYCVLDLRGGWNKSSTIGFRPPAPAP
jgi:glycine/D-amino acid oxidase-like deaminating enzyme